MNAEPEQAQTSTPPRGRTAYDMAVDYAAKSRRFHNEATRVSHEYYARADQGEFGGSHVIAQIAASEDNRWKIAVEEQKFAERLANLYSNIATMDLTAQVWAELKRLNETLSKKTIY